MYSLRLAIFFNVLSKPFITSPVFQMCFDREYFVVCFDLLSPGPDDEDDSVGGSNAGRSEWRMQFTIRYILLWALIPFFLLLCSTCALRFYRSANPLITLDGGPPRVARVVCAFWPSYTAKHRRMHDWWEEEQKRHFFLIYIYICTLFEQIHVYV